MDDEIEIFNDAENENDNEDNLTKYEKKMKAYMNSYNTIAYLKERMDKDSSTADITKKSRIKTNLRRKLLGLPVKSLEIP